MFMSGTVYVLGAGVNQAIKNFDGISPPLTNNFFQVALKMQKYSTKNYHKKIQSVYDYIKKYWRKGESDLVAEAFDLEECFTTIELQLLNARVLKNNEQIEYLRDVQFKLKSFFAEVISDFQVFASTSKELQQFGRIVFSDKPTIITFNYDCFMEACIELASGLNSDLPETIFKRHSILGEDEITNEEISYSHFI